MHSFYSAMSLPRTFVLLLLTVLAVPALAADAGARLADVLSTARSMEANFEQTVAGSNGVVSQKSQGTMSVSRPQLFRWDVKTPFEQLVIADGKQVWVYDPDLSQAVVRPFDQQLSDTPALLFSGDANKINERFKVTLLEDKGSNLRFELAPRSDDALFESMRIGFRDGRLREMILLDNLGQRTSITFSHTSINPAIPASRFVFTPPPGTDVIRESN